jgi:hypothetical protein
VRTKRQSYQLRKLNWCCRKSFFSLCLFDGMDSTGFGENGNTKLSYSCNPRSDFHQLVTFLNLDSSMPAVMSIGLSKSQPGSRFRHLDNVVDRCLAVASPSNRTDPNFNTVPSN